MKEFLYINKSLSLLKISFFLLIFSGNPFMAASQSSRTSSIPNRERISLNDDWKFMRYTSTPDNLMYDERPVVTNHNDDVVADTKPTEAIAIISSGQFLKKWILPSANDFIKDPAKHHHRPNGNPGNDFPFVQSNFNDGDWEPVNLPHDWAINGPFYTGPNPEVGGGMGRLPSHGIAWYRKKLNITNAEKGKSIYIEIDGAMAYAMVWLNGILVGGWPYGYNSFQLDLTPYINFGGVNQLAIRLDNPPNSSRWYPGGGIYRNVWLLKVSPLHVAQWGTFIRARKVSTASATIDLEVNIENNSANDQTAELHTNIFVLDASFKKTGKPIATFSKSLLAIKAGEKKKLTNAVTISNPKLWGPLPAQKPNLYVAVTSVQVAGKIVDVYEKEFGIRSLQFDPLKGLLVNDIPVKLQGVNQHHDLGALGAAFNLRAAERQLEILQEMGCNAIRISHNPPAPELLDLTDRMGMLVIDEIFDSWERKKTPLDFHLIFKDWYEPDIRSFIRRDRNHPSVIAWSFGNEVGEQYTGEEGATIARLLNDIVKEEDNSRPSTASMNYAKPDMPFPATMDLLSLNYQGEGIRDAPAYQHLRGIKTSPLYDAFKKQFPDKLIVSSETASTLSTRGTYLFPVHSGNSAPVSDSTGGNSIKQQVSSYELYTAQFGASPDKVFAMQDKYPFVSGEFVWSGWDYLGEPTPYYSARSSYSGIIDLAGFKKDRFYLYQARWRPQLPMVHILPHWTWKDRAGEITPVHVFTSGDEVELFLNGSSLGRKKKGEYEYRLRWDSVKYAPGNLKAVAYKNGKKWAEQSIQTAGNPTALKVSADRYTLTSDNDLSFITVSVIDANGITIPDASNIIEFSIEGPGEIVATDNGDPADLVAFNYAKRAAYSGFALAIIRSKKGAKSSIKVIISSAGIKTDSITLMRN